MKSRKEAKGWLITRKLKQINLMTATMMANPVSVSTSTIKDLRYFVDGLDTMLQRWERR